MQVAALASPAASHSGNSDLAARVQTTLLALSFNFHVSELPVYSIYLSRIVSRKLPDPVAVVDRTGSGTYRYHPPGYLTGAQPLREKRLGSPQVGAPSRTLPFMIEKSSCAFARIPTGIDGTQAAFRVQMLRIGACGGKTSSEPPLNKLGSTTGFASDGAVSLANLSPESNYRAVLP